MTSTTTRHIIVGVWAFVLASIQYDTVMFTYASNHGGFPPPQQQGGGGGGMPPPQQGGGGGGQFPPPQQGGGGVGGGQFPPPQQGDGGGQQMPPPQQGGGDGTMPPPQQGDDHHDGDGGDGSRPILPQCSEDGSDYVYEETISEDGNTRIITTTWCPNHPYALGNPNRPIKKLETYQVPAKPIYVDMINPTIDLSEIGNLIGITFSSTMIFSPYGGTRHGQATSLETSAAYQEAESFDQCGGHSSNPDIPSYHYHTSPPCLLQQLQEIEDSTGTVGEHSPQIGWAGDGFPIYGPYGPNGLVMKTCQVTGGIYGIDDCLNDNGGLYRELPGVDDFVFRYYTIGETNDGLQCEFVSKVIPYPGTDPDNFPNTPTGFYGCCPNGVECSAWWLPNCSEFTSDNLEMGYTYNDATAKYPTGLPYNTEACEDAITGDAVEDGSESGVGMDGDTDNEHPPPQEDEIVNDPPPPQEEEIVNGPPPDAQEEPPEEEDDIVDDPPSLPEEEKIVDDPPLDAQD